MLCSFDPAFQVTSEELKLASFYILILKFKCACVFIRFNSFHFIQFQSYVPSFLIDYFSCIRSQGHVLRLVSDMIVIEFLALAFKVRITSGLLIANPSIFFVCHEGRKVR